MLDAGLTKLDDANNAGGRSSEQCTLILTEGDSAKSLVIAGMSVAGRDNFGVFPLRHASTHNLLQRCWLGSCIWAGIAGGMQAPHLFGTLSLRLAVVVARRGKLLNVRDASVTQINGNAEINAIKQILGLQHGKVAVTFPSVGRQCHLSSWG